MKALLAIPALAVTVPAALAVAHQADVRRYQAFTDLMTVEIVADDALRGTYFDRDVLGEANLVVERRSHCYGGGLGAAKGATSLRVPHLVLTIGERPAEVGRRRFRIAATISAPAALAVASPDEWLDAKPGPREVFYDRSVQVEVAGTHASSVPAARWNAQGDSDPELREALEKALPPLLDDFSRTMGEAREALYGADAPFLQACPVKDEFVRDDARTTGFPRPLSKESPS